MVRVLIITIVRVVFKTHKRSLSTTVFFFFMGTKTEKEKRTKFSSSVWITWPGKAKHRSLRKAKVVLLFTGLTIALLMSI